MAHKIFVTDAVVKTFGNLIAVEQYAQQSAAGLLKGQAVSYVLEDPDGNQITVDTECHSNRIIVSIRGDDDKLVKCLECLKAGRMETRTTH